jgi:glycosyltransferase involved in cell wall biosynthesis
MTPGPRSETETRPVASIVVPTRDRPEALSRCLDALDAQTLKPELEIVVVDDGSRLRGAVSAAVDAHDGVRLLRVESRGPASARNAGIASASAEIVCLTDDDCEPAADWAERLVEAIRSGADVAAGFTYNACSGEAFAEATQVIATVLRRPDTFGRLRFATSNNLASKTSVFADIPFDERFATAAGEDRDWCARATGAGLEIRAEPRALVAHRHHVDAAGFWRQHVQYGRGAYRFRSTHAGAATLERPSFYAGLLRAAFAAGPLVGLAVCAAQVATAAGYARAALADARARR